MATLATDIKSIFENVQSTPDQKVLIVQQDQWIYAEEKNTMQDFYDEKHLNAVGVRKFNLDLCRSMSSTQ